MNSPAKPRVFVDADVLFAGAAGPTTQGASLVVLRIAEITLLHAITSQQAIDECTRNLAAKLPAALPTFQVLAQRCLHIVSTPTPNDVLPFTGLADPKDLPILTAAIREHCRWLVTFNGRHYQLGHAAVTVLQPGAFIQQVRHLLAHLTSSGED